MKKTISFIIIVLMITFIWSNSFQDSTNSYKFSMFFTKSIQFLLIKLGLHPNLNIMGVFVRKLAHLTEFMSLGAIIYYTFKQFFKTHIAPKSILLAISIASLDEVIQIYSPGRTATITDVLLDTTGSMIGILIMKRLLKLIH